jgi:prepilin-type N-terminal cleavage/methylation domain-containing protein
MPDKQMGHNKLRSRNNAGLTTVGLMMVLILRSWNSKKSRRPARAQSGFTLIELMMVLLISSVVMAFAVPSVMNMTQILHTGGDSRNLAGLIAEAKMRAAANFTHARVYASISGNSYHVEVWNKSGNGGAGCWQTDGDINNACTAASSPVVELSSKVSFGYGNITSPPANTESSIGQAPACYTGYAGESTNTTFTANTACIEFNSRGVPSDPDPSGSSGSAGGVPDATGALYLTDGASVYAATVLATGAIQTWYSANTATPNWQQR